MYTVTGCLCHNACGVAMSVATTMTTMTRDENEHDDRIVHHPFPHRPSILTHCKSPYHATRSKIRSFWRPHLDVRGYVGVATCVVGACRDVRCMSVSRRTW